MTAAMEILQMRADVRYQLDRVHRRNAIQHLHEAGWSDLSDGAGELWSHERCQTIPPSEQIVMFWESALRIQDEWERNSEPKPAA